MFSLCSRLHRLWGHRTAAETCSALFGHPRHGAAHDFAVRVHALAVATSGTLGDEVSIVQKHTLLPFYLHFVPATLAVRTLEDSRFLPQGSVKFRLGLLTSGFRAHHPLKACPRCMQEDRERHGIAHWRVAHQLPGALTCHRHGQQLWASPLKSSGVQRFQWLLPEDALLAPIDVDAQHLPTLRLLTSASLALWQLPLNLQFSMQRAALAYRRRLDELGLLTGTGRLQQQSIGIEFYAHTSVLRSYGDLHPLPNTPLAAAHAIARLVGCRPGGCHTLRHLAAITWLFETMADFVAAASTAEAASNESPRRHCREVEAAAVASTHHGGRNYEALLQLTSEGHSISRAAHALGVHPSTAQAWLAALGRASQKRPKTMTGSIRSEMVAALQQGTEKQEVAAIGGVSSASVTRLLRTEVGLRQAWINARRILARNHHREAWADAVCRCTEAGSPRRMASAAYTWLRRHDRDWLTANLSRERTYARRQSSRVDWSERDTLLARSICSAAMDLKSRTTSLGKGGRVTIPELCMAIASLRPLLRNLNRLPLTRLAIEQATQGSGATASTTR